MKKLLDPAYLLVIAVSAILVVMTAAGIFFANTFRFTPVGHLDRPGEHYVALFLTNGQVYFGKIDHIDRDYTVLTDIYYLQVEQSAQAQTARTVSIVKLGGEIQGPEDVIMFNTSQIVYMEHLKDDSQVVQKITRGQVPQDHH